MSQKKLIIEKLKLDNFVSRNWALKNYITRLGAIIHQLNREGWELEGKNENGDYVYEVKKSGLKKLIYRLK